MPDATENDEPGRTAIDDARVLRGLGYKQELSRRMSGFSNFAISFSIICILAGGVSSFHLGLSSVGGASIGLGWPLVALFSMAVAATMGQLASAFPTAGGLYHWAAILGGRGWGWATAWFNLAGLVTVLGRLDSQVSVGGLKVDLTEVEHTLTELPGVDAAVVLFDREITAFVQLAGGHAEQSVTAALAERLAGYKRPRTTHFVAALPRTTTGKLVRDRTVLRAAIS